MSAGFLLSLINYAILWYITLLLSAENVSPVLDLILLLTFFGICTKQYRVFKMRYSAHHIRTYFGIHVDFLVLHKYTKKETNINRMTSHENPLYIVNCSLNAYAV